MSVKILAAMVMAIPVWAQEPIADTTQIEDPWLGFDKAQHVAVSFCSVLALQYIGVNKFDLQERTALPVSVGFTAILGLTKEIRDLKRQSRHFSRRDLVANGVGLILASAVVLTEADR